VRAAVTAVFALNGALFASVFSRLPAIRDDLGLGEGRIGLALAAAMIGLLVAQPLAGAAASRLGTRRLVVAGAAGYAVGVALVGAAGSFAALAGAFLVVGVCNGVLDVSMNLNGLAVERRLGRRVLSSLHAAFSLGALGGAAAGAVVAGAGVEHGPHLAVAAGAGVAVLVVVAGRLVADRPAPDERPPAFARPSRALAALGGLAFCVLLAEGAINDWAAVYLAADAGASDATAGAGLAAFSGAMAAGRLAGDRATAALGAPRLVRSGALLGAAGLALAVASARPAPVLAGLVLAGLGLAALFPVALRAAGDAASVAAVSTLGYVAFLTGPPLIGGLAELLGLRTALLVPVACCLAAAALSRRSAAAAPGPAGRPAAAAGRAAAAGSR